MATKTTTDLDTLRAAIARIEGRIAEGRNTGRHYVSVARLARLKASLATQEGR